MYGVFLALLTTHLIEKTTRQTLLTSIVTFVGYNLVYGLKGGIDNAAHIGGLVGGIVIGYAFIPSLQKPAMKYLKLASIGALTVITLATSLVVYNHIPNDIGTYNAKMKAFVEMEEMALAVYRLPQDAPKEKLLYEIKDNGIHNWNEIIKLIDEAETLNLPAVLHEKNKKLKQYCELRIKSYELIYKAIDEDTDSYKAQIEDYTKQIENIISELGAGQKEK
jgi:rhomboid protease GluP